MLLSAWYTTIHNFGACGLRYTTKFEYIVPREIEAFDFDKTDKIEESGTNWSWPVIIFMSSRLGIDFNGFCYSCGMYGKWNRDALGSK
jgi:hypothetical protein